MIKKISIILPAFFIVFFLFSNNIIYSQSIQKETPNLVRVAILEENAAIYANEKKLRGDIDIIRKEDGTLLVINRIDIEDYLRGVLNNEVSHWWPMEALKAQAIASRTYALYQAKIRQNADYDLTSDVSSQVYGGKLSERWRTDWAVRATKGQVLTYDGEIFPTYFHAACGGHTKDASDLWNENIEPLKGTKCSFCRISPHYRWEKSIPLPEIERRLKKAGFSVGKIKFAEEILNIPAKDFRRAIGNNIIRSTNFSICRGGPTCPPKTPMSAPKTILCVSNNTAHFKGYGWGHGVGMCQWGAYFLSKRHYKADEILRYYYPRTKIKGRF